MAATIEQFITSLKLRELRAQRDYLRSAYAVLDSRLAAADSVLDRARLLYDGLRSIHFAGHAIHPDVANLEPLLADDGGSGGRDTLGRWAARLERELAHGRLRAEIGYIYAALLEQQAGEQAPVHAESQANGMRELLLSGIRQTSAGCDLPPTLNLVATLLQLDTQETAELMQAEVTRTVLARVEAGELERTLRHIGLDELRPAALRAQARRVEGHAILLQELADALTITLLHLDEWDWPPGGVGAYASQTRTKWRLFLEEDLPTAAFLEVLGRRWHRAFDRFLRAVRDVQVARLNREPSQGTSSLARLMRQSMRRSGWNNLGEHNLWAEPARQAAVEGVYPLLAEQVQADGAVGSIIAQRAAMQRKLYDLDEHDSYQGKGYSRGTENALSLVNAEIALARTAFPDRPLYVLKVDLRDYYPSVSHDLVLALLGRLGLGARERAFFERYLRVPVREQSGNVVTQRGLPNDHYLSDALGELLAGLIEQAVRGDARVASIRMLDDFCFLTHSAADAVKAWRAIGQFCDTLGLAVNEEKCGAVALGGVLPSELPATLPVWGMLALDRDGHWRVDQPKFSAYLDQARRELEQEASLPRRVQRYNVHVEYLMRALGLSVVLDEEHRLAAGDAMRRLHTEFLGPGLGMVEVVRTWVHGSILSGSMPMELPEAWLYWPVTAGGLGVRQAMVAAAAYNLAFDGRQRISPPNRRESNWQAEGNEWSRWYGTLLKGIKPLPPTPNQVMEALVRDFIQRGADLSDGKQTSLSPYWRWILYLYGPQILDDLGTFRFLPTAFVPIQLLTRQIQSAMPDAPDDADNIPF